MTHSAYFIIEFGVCSHQIFMTNSLENLWISEQLDNDFLSLSINDKCLRNLYPAKIDDRFCEKFAGLRTAREGFPFATNHLRRSTSTVNLNKDEQQGTPGATTRI